MERHEVRPVTLTLPTASRERLAGFIVAHAGYGVLRLRETFTSKVLLRSE